MMMINNSKFKLNEVYDPSIRLCGVYKEGSTHSYRRYWTPNGPIRLPQRNKPTVAVRRTERTVLSSPKRPDNIRSHPASYSIDIVSSRDMRLTTRLNLVSTLRTGGAIPPIFPSPRSVRGRASFSPYLLISSSKGRSPRDDGPPVGMYSFWAGRYS
jgi:hypothetical protein